MNVAIHQRGYFSNPKTVISKYCTNCIIIGVILSFGLNLLYPVSAYSDPTVEKVGSLEVVVKFRSGDRIEPWGMMLKVYQDSLENPFTVVDPMPRNPYVLDSLPLGHTYLVEVYISGIWAETGTIELTSQAELPIIIPFPGGMRINFFYNDGFTPVEGATVSLKSSNGTLLWQGVTDSEGNTVRFWMQPTIRDSDQYIATISIAKNLEYEYPTIRLESGVIKEIKVVTPWVPSIGEVKVSVYKTISEKVNESDGKFLADMYDINGKKISTALVNRKGDAYFTNLRVGDYVLHVTRERENLLHSMENWSTYNVTLEGSNSIKLVRNEPLVSSWQLVNTTMPSFYNTTFSATILNPSLYAKKPTISLILDRDRLPPYDMVQNLTLSISGGSLNKTETRVMASEEGVYYLYIIATSENGNIITDQIPWQYAFEVKGKVSAGIPGIPDNNFTNPLPGVPKNVTNDDSPSLDALQRVPHTCMCVAFRLDDIQDYWAREAQMDLMRVFLDANAPFTLGIIGGGLHDDSQLIQFIQNSTTTGLIEVANRGWTYSDHSAMTINEQRDSIAKTNEKIRSLFGIEAKTFLPPYDGFNNNTLSAMQEIGLTHLSSSMWFDKAPYPLKDSDPIFHFPAGAVTGRLNLETNQWEIYSVPDMLKAIRDSIQTHGFAVVVMYPGSYYYNQNGTYVYQKQSVETVQTLVEAVKKEFNLVKISEIDRQGWIPEDVFSDVNLHHSVIPAKPDKAIVSTSADFSVEMREQTLLLKAEKPLQQPILLMVPEALMPQEPFVIANDENLPLMKWFDSDSKTWILYVNPPDSLEQLQVRVVPEFSSTLVILIFTFVFLLLVIVPRIVRRSEVHITA